MNIKTETKKLEMITELYSQSDLGRMQDIFVIPEEMIFGPKSRLPAEESYSSMGDLYAYQPLASRCELFSPETLYILMSKKNYVSYPYLSWILCS